MIKIGTKPLTAGDFHKILYQGEKVELDAAAYKKVAQSHEFLKKFSKNKLTLADLRNMPRKEGWLQKKMREAQELSAAQGRSMPGQPGAQPKSGKPGKPQKPINRK